MFESNFVEEFGVLDNRGGKNNQEQNKKQLQQIFKEPKQKNLLFFFINFKFFTQFNKKWKNLKIKIKKAKNKTY